MDSPGRTLHDKGLQMTYREDLTSQSGESRSAAAFFGLEQSRRTVQTAGFNNTETFDG